MRLHNATAGMFVELMGPFGPLAPIPDNYVNRRDLRCVTLHYHCTGVLTRFVEAECIALANYLGLPALPDPPTLKQRRHQITSYLGVIVTSESDLEYEPEPEPELESEL